MTLRPALSLALLLGAQPAPAQEAPSAWSWTAYLQRSWPKQTETNRQIREQINGTFGSHFQTWADVATLSAGVKVFRRLSPTWKLGLEADYSRGGIEGTETVVHPLAGPATLSFEQTYSIYSDLLLLAQFMPLGTQGRWVPFAFLGGGIVYEKNRTLLTLRNAYLDERLQVDNSGWFPSLTTGIGVEVPLGERRLWFLEAGLSHTWSRLKHTAPVSGTPGLTGGATAMTADTDSTGFAVWFGAGRRF